MGRHLHTLDLCPNHETWLIEIRLSLARHPNVALQCCNGHWIAKEAKKYSGALRETKAVSLKAGVKSFISILIALGD